MIFLLESVLHLFNISYSIFRICIFVAFCFIQSVALFSAFLVDISACSHCVAADFLAHFVTFVFLFQLKLSFILLKFSLNFCLFQLVVIVLNYANNIQQCVPFPDFSRLEAATILEKQQSIMYIDHAFHQYVHFCQMLLTTLFSNIFREEQSILLEKIYENKRSCNQYYLILAIQFSVTPTSFKHSV